jgi:hypothetical protein
MIALVALSAMMVGFSRMTTGVDSAGAIPLSGVLASFLNPGGTVRMVLMFGGSVAVLGLVVSAEEEEEEEEEGSRSCDVVGLLFLLIV